MDLTFKGSTYIRSKSFIFHETGIYIIKSGPRCILKNMHGVHNLFYDGIMYPPALRLHEDIHNTALSRANYSTRNPQINAI